MDYSQYDKFLHHINIVLILILVVLMLFSVGCTSMTPLQQEDFDYRQRMTAIAKVHCVVPRVWDKQMRRCLREIY